MLKYLTVDHDKTPNQGDEEVEVVWVIVAGPHRTGASWIGSDRNEARIISDDILNVATSRSLRDLATVLSEQGISVRPNADYRLLREELGPSRRQALEDRPLGDCQDRDAQVKRIDELRRHFTCWGHIA